nr:hypothetical protein [Tanacetum cinerariifolium]
MFSSDLDGRPIRRKDVGLLIKSDVFKKLNDNDAVSLCCVGILQLMLLGVEDRHPVPNWILSDPTNETDTKSYSIEGFAWAFKTWILESFRAATDDYYTRYRRHPQIVSWTSKHKFYRHMLKPMLHGQIPVERLVPDETEARSRWWVSSRAHFDGQKGYQQMKENNDDMYGKMTRFMEDMRQVPEANTTPIIADQHFGVSDISGFQSYQSNWLSPLNWQTPNPSYLGTPNSQPPIPSQPGTSNWQNPVTSRRQDAGILDPNLCDRARRKPQSSVYMPSPYTVLPPTTVLTKKKIDKTKKKGKTKKLSPLNLGNNFADKNVSVDDVTITGVQQTDNYFNYETVDPDKVTRDAYVPMIEFLLDPYDIYLDCYMKGYKLPSFFWPQLVRHLCTYRCERSWPEGWLSSDILIREKKENANWTLAKSGTVCLHPENNHFMILTDPHNIRTLDGLVRPFS